MRFLVTFVNLLALVWVGSESIALAGAGVRWPMFLLILAGVIAFSLIGCLPVKKPVMNLGVLILTGAVVLTGLYFAGTTIGTAPIAGLLKFVGVGLIVLFGYLGLKMPDEVDAH